MQWRRFLVGFLLVASTAGAHDLWIVPGQFVLRPGESIRVFINSGDAFPSSDSLLGQHRVERFSLITERGREPVTGLATDGKSLTAEVAVAAAGTAVLALATRSRLVRLKADEFNEYLEDDGLPQILAFRAEHDEMTQPAVERYTKFAKAILTVGEETDGTWKVPAGLRMEIVPEREPNGLKPGEILPVRVLFEGEPVSGLTVTATRAGGPRNELTDVTDAEGRARFLVSRTGRWYLHVVHMVRLENDPQIQWESFWATLTFEVMQ